MIPEGIQAIFDFIDYLDSRKEELIKVYIPLCEELEELRKRKNQLTPERNYRERRQYEILEAELDAKSEPLILNVYQPIARKLKETEIWSGDFAFSSIKNSILASTRIFKDCFQDDDVVKVNHYKKKYLSFRNDTNSSFLTLGFAFVNLDKALKELFDFFNDTDDEELEGIDYKVIECRSFEEMFKLYHKNPKENLRFEFPSITKLNNPTHGTIRGATNNTFLSKLSFLIKQVERIVEASSDSIETSYEEALKRVSVLKQVIENQDGYKIFDNSENHKEFILQLMFRFIIESSKWDTNSEVNNGRGPADFTFSKGAQDKTIVELKLAKNSSLKYNLKHQVEVYKKANNTNKAVVVILYFTDAEFKKLERILQELGLNDQENIVSIDGRKKLSASKVRE